MRTFDTAPAPHLPPRRSVRGTMGLVLLALVPGVLAHGWFFGPGIFVQILLAVAFDLEIALAMINQPAGDAEPFPLGLPSTG